MFARALICTGRDRICFRWHADDAYEVEIVDYH
jgi:plasmid maintenance system killer protein